MPSLLELQHAMRNSILHGSSGAVAAMFADNSKAGLLDIYRNTVLIGLTKTLRLCYPAVERLVGAEFFEGAAHFFIAEHPPRNACLDEYGDEFSGFLARFPPASSVCYLADVARLEWAVQCAIHAPHERPLELAQAAIPSLNDRHELRFIPEPSIRLLHLNYEADRIWSAVLDRDNTALAALNTERHPLHLLVERHAGAISIVRLVEPEWRFLDMLCARKPLHVALEASTDFDAASALADHLANGRFTAVEWIDGDPTVGNSLSTTGVLS